MEVVASLSQFDIYFNLHLLLPQQRESYIFVSLQSAVILLNFYICGAGGSLSHHLSLVFIL
jgi:hypothetical protein